ncbi:MAG TPA: alcohol dehydrogenase, partial [Firmicutes bacterium]|nr:alcohol dehydrogenase [Bacillota bacterium]
QIEPVIDQRIKLGDLNHGLQLIKEGKLKGRLVMDME